MTPVNRDASVVTSQSGCTETETIDQRYDSLALALRVVRHQLLTAEGDEKKELGSRHLDLQQQLCDIKKEKKADNVKNRGLQHYILDECRTRFTSSEWKELIKIASANKFYKDGIYND